MNMLYQSEHYVVVHFDGDDDAATGSLARRGVGGFEIVDRLAQREIFIGGELAEVFHRGVARLAQADSGPEDFDAFIGGYTGLAQQPLVLH